MSTVIAAVVVGPLLAAAAGLAVRNRGVVRDLITIGTLATVTGLAAWLLALVDRDGTVVVRVGGWDPELGIVLVADLFAALILLVSVATILVVEIFAIGQRRTAWGADPRLAGPDPARPDRRGLAGHPHRRPLHAVRRVRADPGVQLRAADPPGPPGADPVGHDLRGDEPVRLDAVPDRGGVRLRRHRHGQHGAARRADPRARRRRPPRASGCGSWWSSAPRPPSFPLFSWLPDSYPTAPTTITAVFAGPAHQDRRLLADPVPHPHRHGRSGSGHPGRRRHHDDRRRRRRAGPGRREAHPVVPHRQPDRLHADGPRPVHRGRRRRGDPVPGPSDPDQDRAVPRRRAHRGGGGHLGAGPGRRSGGARTRCSRCSSPFRRSAWPACRRSRGSWPSWRWSMPGSPRWPRRSSSSRWWAASSPCCR